MTLEIPQALGLLVAGHDFVTFHSLSGEVQQMTPRQASLLILRRHAKITGSAHRVKKITELPMPCDWQPCWRTCFASVMPVAIGYGQ